MADWVDFARWNDCAKMERPGYVFEVVNAEGLSLLTGCAQPLQTPWDWKSGPVRFRLVEAPRPRHSNPIPAPRRP